MESLRQVARRPAPGHDRRHGLPRRPRDVRRGARGAVDPGRGRAGAARRAAPVVAACARRPGRSPRAYDAQLRTRVPEPLPEQLQVDQDEPVVRMVVPWGGLIGYRDLGGLDGAELDAFIARQVQHFAERGKSVRVEVPRPRPAGRPPGAARRGRLRGGGARDGRHRAGRAGRRQAGPARRCLAARGHDAGRLRSHRRARGGDLGRGPRRHRGHVRIRAGGDPESISIVVAEAAGEVVSRPGSASSTAPSSRRCGAARRCRSGAGAGSIGRPSPTARHSPPSAGSASSRSIRRTTAGRSWSGSGSSRSPRRRRSCGSRRASPASMARP